MRKIREMLRLKWVAQRSHREVARSLGVSAGAVASAVSRARALGLTWDAVEALRDDALEQRLYGPRAADVAGPRPEPDLAWVHRELRRPGVTLELLHVEYLAAHPTGYRDAAFCGVLHPQVHDGQLDHLGVGHAQVALHQHRHGHQRRRPRRFSSAHGPVHRYIAASSS